MDPAQDSCTSEECTCSENHTPNNPECAVVPFPRLGDIGLYATSQQIQRQQEERNHSNPESQGRFEEINHVLDDKGGSVIGEKSPFHSLKTNQAVESDADPDDPPHECPQTDATFCSSMNR